MICARCDKPILPGEEFESRDIHSASGPGMTVRIHVSCRPDRAAQPRRYPS